MSISIYHNSTAIVVLQDWETPSVHCTPNQLFVQPTEGQYWVSSWDGQEVWILGTDWFPTEEAAIAAAKEAVDQM